MKVAIYTRVSTKEQSVEMQILKCKSYCEYSKHEVYKIYKDIAESGKKESRPAFDEMLKDMRKGKFKGLVVYKLDRMGRSLAHLISLFEEFKRRDIEFISVTQNIDSSTPEGKLFMRIMMIMSEYERELTVNRVIDGIARAKREGKTLGRPKVKLNKYEVIRLKKEGMSYRKIAEKLELSLGVVQRTIKQGVDE